MAAITESTARTLGELIDIAGTFAQARRCPVWFRGNAQGAWHLRPKVFRPEVYGNTRQSTFETSLVHNFQRQAFLRTSATPPEEDCVGWLCLMQHHGLPTRLLDWTTSPLVAGFFGSRGGHDPADGVVWALDPMQLNESQFGTPEVLSPNDIPGRLACYLAFVYGDTQAVKSHLELLQRLSSSSLAMEPKESNLRMLLQQARFTIHGDATPIEEEVDASKFLLRIRIPPEAKKEVREKLALCGLRESTLFPDLDHLAAELQRYARDDWGW